MRARSSRNRGPSPRDTLMDMLSVSTDVAKSLLAACGGDVAGAAILKGARFP